MKKLKLIILIIVLISSLFILSGCSTNEVETNEVSDNQNNASEERDLYMIGTENEVFKIEDNLFIGKFNSSDLYNQIEIGKQYKIKTTGVRNNFMSWYRNINSIELCEGD